MVIGTVGRRAGRASLATAAVIALIAGASALAAPNETTLVSRASGASGATAAGNNVDPDISGNGRFVAWVSTASNLGLPDGVSSAVFVRDREQDKTTIVSRKNGKQGDVIHGFNPQISGAGRYIAFEGSASIFRRDTKAGNTRTVDNGSGECCGSGFNQSRPAIAANGATVAWVSGSSDPPFETHVYIRDIGSPNGEIVAIDRANGSKGALAKGLSTAPSVSAGGRYVAFESNGSNLPDANGMFQVYLRDRHANKTYLVSRSDGKDGAPVSEEPITPTQFDPVISDDGRYVAFQSFAKLDPAAVTEGIGEAAFEGVGPQKNIYVRDTQENHTYLVSRATGADGVGGENGGTTPAISGDGRYVSFESNSLSLRPPAVSSDGAAGYQVFVRDLETNKTIWVSQSDAGVGSDGNAVDSSVSTDGSLVAFQAQASNLGDATFTPDNLVLHEIYVRELP